jgi:hypothetical protein
MSYSIILIISGSLIYLGAQPYAAFNNICTSVQYIPSEILFSFEYVL